MKLLLIASKYPSGLACLAKVTKCPPQTREDRLGLLAHLRVDERRVVGLAELRPLLVDDLDVGLELLDVLDEGRRSTSWP